MHLSSMRWEAAAPMVSPTACDRLRGGVVSLPLTRVRFDHHVHREGCITMTTRRNALKLSAAFAAAAASLHLPGEFEPHAIAAPADAPSLLSEPAAPWPLAPSTAGFDRLFGPDSPLYESSYYAAYQRVRAAFIAHHPIVQTGVGALAMARLDAAAERLFWVAWERGIAHGMAVVQLAGPLALKAWCLGADPVAGALAWLRFYGDGTACAPESLAYTQVLEQVSALDPQQVGLYGGSPLALLDEAVVAMQVDAWDFGVCIGANEAGLITPDRLNGDLPPGVEIADFALPALAA
jgi:hypothetical protein